MSDTPTPQTTLAVDTLPIAWMRLILSLFALAGETVKGGAQEVKARVLRQPGTTKYQAVAVNFAPVQVDDDVVLQANARIVEESKPHVVRVRLFNPFGIDLKRGHPLTQSGVPGLLMTPADWDRKGRYYKLIPFGYAPSDLLDQLNKLLEREKQTLIPAIPHTLQTVGSVVFAFTPTNGEDTKAGYYIGSCLGTQLFLDKRSGDLPLSKGSKPIETAFAVNKFMEGRAYVTVLGPAKEINLKRLEINLDVGDRVDVDPFALAGVTIDQIDPDPYSRSPWTVRQVIGRLIGNPGDERLQQVVLSSGMVVQTDPVPVCQQMAIGMLRQAEPLLNSEVRLRWDKITDPTVSWTDVTFPTQGEALQGRERRDWYRRVLDGDLIAPIVAQRMTQIFGAEIAFDAKNPWHRSLRAWVFKTKCERSVDAPEEKEPEDETKINPDEVPGQLPEAEVVPDSDVPPEVLDTEVGSK